MSAVSSNPSEGSCSSYTPPSPLTSGTSQYGSIASIFTAHVDCDKLATEEILEMIVKLCQQNQTLQLENRAYQSFLQHVSSSEEASLAERSKEGEDGEESSPQLSSSSVTTSTSCVPGKDDTVSALPASPANIRGSFGRSILAPLSQTRVSQVSTSSSKRTPTMLLPASRGIRVRSGLWFATMMRAKRDAAHKLLSLDVFQKAYVVKSLISNLKEALRSQMSLSSKKLSHLQAQYEEKQVSVKPILKYKHMWEGGVSKIQKLEATLVEMHFPAGEIGIRKERQIFPLHRRIIKQKQSSLDSMNNEYTVLTNRRARIKRIEQMKTTVNQESSTYSSTDLLFLSVSQSQAKWKQESVINDLANLHRSFVATFRHFVRLKESIHRLTVEETELLDDTRQNRVDIQRLEKINKDIESNLQMVQSRSRQHDESQYVASSGECRAPTIVDYMQLINFCEQKEKELKVLERKLFFMQK